VNRVSASGVINAPDELQRSATRIIDIARRPWRRIPSPPWKDVSAARGAFWIGELHGYHVHIGPCCDEWFVWLMPGGQWTERCLRVGSLAEGAKLAREWIEKLGDKRLRRAKRK
jgi:hypothetical protein